MFVTPLVQSKLRQLLGLSGGPLVQVIDAVQPVVLLAGESSRQPQLEKGDTIPRRWVSFITRAALAANYSIVCVRPGASRTFYHVEDVTITNVGAAVQFYLLGRSTLVGIVTAGSSHYVDTRLPWSDLFTGDIYIGAAVVAALPTTTGYHYVAVPAGSSVTVRLDWIVVPSAHQGSSGSMFIVTPDTVNQGITCSFRGVTYDLPNV